MTEDELAHYGVMGMKWGHRRAATTSQIKTARANLSVKRSKYEAQRQKVKNTAKGAARDRQAKTLGNMKVSFLKDPDRVIAARMTRGEKALTLLLTGVTGVGIVAGGAAIAGTSAASRRIEKKQDDGAYDKKK